LTCKATTYRLHPLTSPELPLFLRCYVQQLGLAGECGRCVARGLDVVITLKGASGLLDLVRQPEWFERTQAEQPWVKSHKPKMWTIAHTEDSLRGQARREQGGQFERPSAALDKQGALPQHWQKLSIEQHLTCVLRLPCSLWSELVMVLLQATRRRVSSTKMYPLARLAKTCRPEYETSLMASLQL